MKVLCVLFIQNMVRTNVETSLKMCKRSLIAKNQKQTKPPDSTKSCFKIAGDSLRFQCCFYQSQEKSYTLPNELYHLKLDNDCFYIGNLCLAFNFF